MAEPVLDIRNLSYRYPSRGEPRAAALRSVELTVEPGEFVLLAGASGSGKSSLIRAACGLIPHFHGGEITGTVKIAGHDSARHGPAELARLVGFVAQEPETQVVSTTVAAELELPLELRGVGAAQRARAVEEVALALGIADLAERTTDTLSGGELQRVAIGAALVSRPALLLLDEPTSQLDPLAGDELISLLRRLNEEWGVAVVVAEHRLERFLGAADRVVAMAAGGVIWDGPVEDFGEACERGAGDLMPPLARAFALAGRRERPSTTRAARALLRAGGGSQQLWASPPGTNEAATGRQPWRPREQAGDRAGNLALIFNQVSVGYPDDPNPVASNLNFRLHVGERVALMGASGVGKSSILRSAAGLLASLSGRIEVPGGIALLGQRPDDYFVRERIGEELPGAAGEVAMEAVGLEVAAELDPRDLSGGQRQRLALAIAMAGRGAGGTPPGLICLDEPTRGLDPLRKRKLSAWLAELAGAPSAVMVATHDVEFAAEFAERVILMARGRLIADGPASEVLGDGWYFATEAARVSDGAAITPEDLAQLLRTPEPLAATEVER